MKNQHSILLGIISALTVCCILYIVYSAFYIHSKTPAAPNLEKNSTSYPSLKQPKHIVLQKRDVAAQQDCNYTESLQDTSPSNKEALIHFKSADAYQNFLTQLSNRGLKLLGSSNRLLATRVTFGDFSQLEGIEDADISPNYPVFTPTPPDVSAQDSAVAFGNAALDAIGITEDNSQWGEGVTVAVIDSGVNDHLALKEGVQQIALTELSDDSEQLGHGTAVASIIAGKHPLTPGVAPSAEILSIRVTDEFGSSNSFTLAQGILQAADSGAQIINISMGSTGNSSVVAEAVRYAQEIGAVIVASSGNEGLAQAAYPAAYEGVISVGAIEANGDHLDFSNSSPDLQITAPGYQVNAAWGDDLLTSFSGTSASAPFVSGAIAATMSNNVGYTVQQATELLFNYVNEAGPLGDDPQYGKGTLDIGRVIERNTPDLNDIAVTSQFLTTNDAGDREITVIFQNQGTSSLFNSPAQIVTPAGSTQISINSLSPGQTYSTTIPAPTLIENETLSIYSSVNTSSTDVDPLNNSKENHFQTDSE